jgi:hypothetical protein
MIKKIKNLIRENRESQQLIIRQNKELEWAHIYHDSIRGKKHLENLSLNIGRWAGNYTFFYVLNRIMSDVKPKNILEFGLGESSKFISSCIKSEISEAKHQIIEQSQEWTNAFLSKYELSPSTKITVCPLVKKQVNGFEVNCYDGLEELIPGTFDFYLVDGPFGSSHFSRFNIFSMAERLTSNDQFIILIDDFDRIGEQETAQSLVDLFQKKQIKTYISTFEGIKKVWMLVSFEYQFLTTI